MAETMGIGWGRSYLVHLSILQLSVVWYWKPFLLLIAPSKMHSVVFGWSVWVLSPKELMEPRTELHELRAKGAGTPSPQTIFSKAALMGREGSSSETGVHHVSSITCPVCQDTHIKALDLQHLLCWNCSWRPVFSHNQHWLLGPKVKLPIPFAVSHPSLTLPKSPAAVTLSTVWTLGLRSSVNLHIWSATSWITGGFSRRGRCNYLLRYEEHPSLCLWPDSPYWLGHVLHSSVLDSWRSQTPSKSHGSGKHRDVQEVKKEENLKWGPRPKAWVSDTWQGCKGARTELGGRQVGRQVMGWLQVGLMQRAQERRTRWAAFLQTDERETCAKRHKSRDL